MRLRSWLDSNQRDREQMCRAVLALNSQYSDVRPRHPSGGPDGGRDIEASYGSSREAFGAVGFINGANDSKEQKKQISKKFSQDLTSALSANPQLKVFVFLTNLHFTMSEQDKLKLKAKKASIQHCEIIDRERMRIDLDSPSGFFIRFQYLSIPLSEAEQASFLSKYGDQIQDVVTTGFQRVEKTLNRLLFLSEAKNTLGTLTFRFTLKENYPANVIGHLRAFVYLHLREVKHDIFCIWFGTSDRADRFRDNSKHDMQEGIAAGRSTGQWEQHITLRAGKAKRAKQSDTADSQKIDTEEKRRFDSVGWSSGVGMDQVPFILAEYGHDDSLIRFRPRLALRDLDDCSFLPFLNASLAVKLHSFQVFANGYKLADFGPSDFQIDRSECGKDLPGDFTDSELSDPWVRIRPSTFSSSFHLLFSETTPRRMFGHDEPSENLIPSLSR